MAESVPPGEGVWIASTELEPGHEGREWHALHAKVVAFSDEALEAVAQRVAAVLAAWDRR